MGILDSDVQVDGDNLLVGDRVIKLTSIKDPAELPWSELDVDVVIESTGIFRDNESLNKHISAGAKKVLLTVPPKDDIDATIVLGVNDGDLKPEERYLISLLDIIVTFICDFIPILCVFVIHSKH